MGLPSLLSSVVVSNPTVVIISDSVYSSGRAEDDTSGEADISPGEVSSDVLSRVVIGTVVASSCRKDWGDDALGDDGIVRVCGEIVVSSVWTVDADIVVSLRGVVGSGLVVPSMEVVSSVEAAVSVDADIDVSPRNVVDSGSVVCSMEVVSSVVVCQYVDIGSVVVASDSSVNKRRKTLHT